MIKRWKTGISVLLFVLLVSACGTAETHPTQSVQAVVEAAVAATVEVVKTGLAAACEAKVVTATPQPTQAVTGTVVVTPGTVVPTRGGAAGWDVAAFVTDITIVDGTRLPPGTTFKKTWALRNDGVTTWNAGYELVFLSGDQMGSPTATALVQNPVPPGELGLISVELVAPEAKGKYIGFWKIRSPDGTMFGVGADNKPLYTEINVANEYYFLNNLCSASWRAGEDLLYCPSVEGDPAGYYVVNNQLTMENGIGANPSLVMVPPEVQNGEIVGRFNPVRIFSGAHLKSLVGCQFGYEQCKVKMKITYTTADGVEVPIGEYAQYYDGFTQEVDISLKDLGLTGQEIGFNFYVQTDGGPEEDMSFWFNPRLTE